MQLSMFRRAALGSVSAVAVTVALTAAANAQVRVYGGGATLPQTVLRQLFNCYANDVGALPNPRCVDPNAGGIAAVPPAGRVYGYVPTGSSAGQRASMLMDPTRLSPVGVTVVAYADNDGLPSTNPERNPTGLAYSTSAPVGYPAHHFAVSEALLFADDPFSTTPTLTEANCYYGINGDPTCGTVDRRTRFGELKNVPIVSTTVNIPYNLPGATAVLRLTRAQYCGIFTGAITDWNDPAIRSGNAGALAGVTGPRPIRVVTRRDGSGTTFLFVDHLTAACPGWAPAIGPQAGTGGPVGGGGIGSAFACTDTQQPATPVRSAGNSKIGNFWIRPNFFAADGNPGVATTIARNTFTIGYSSPEVVSPAVSTITADRSCTWRDSRGVGLFVPGGTPFAASPSARVQNRSGQFRDPTVGNATAALAASAPPPSTIYNSPISWTVRGRVRDTAAPLGYPISGFTWWQGPTCYNRSDVASAVRGYWDWYTRFGGTTRQAVNIANQLGFGSLPTAAGSNWNAAVRNVLLTDVTRIGRIGTVPACTGVTPGA